MENIKITIKQIGVKIYTKLNIVISILLIYLYFVVYQGHFDCSCKEQGGQCAAYIFLPCVVLLVFILWSDKSFQREWRYTCTCSRFKCKKFLLSLVTHCLKALIVGSLWAEAVLLDGNWYICCLNDHSEQQAQLPCKEPYNYKPEEKEIIAQLKSTSRAVGFGLVAFFGLLTVIWFSLDWKRIFHICCKAETNLKIQLHRLILEENDNLLLDTLRKAVREKISQKLDGYLEEERWERYFDVADELISQSSEAGEDKAGGPETKTRTGQSSSPSTDWDQPGTSPKIRHSVSRDEHSGSDSDQVEIEVSIETSPLIPNDS